jgi:hypothetical protein
MDTYGSVEMMPGTGSTTLLQILLELSEYVMTVSNRFYTNITSSSSGSLHSTQPIGDRITSILSLAFLPIALTGEHC